MKTSLYITDSSLSKGTGGGIVSYNESLALGNVSRLVGIISLNDINPAKWNLPRSPFLMDYIAAFLVHHLKVDIAHLYGGTFTQTVKHLKSNGAKIFVTIAAHNIELSREEHEKLGYGYPYVHMTDTFLWEMFSYYIKDADVVICPSKQSGEYLRQKLQLKNRIVIIPHGCDLPETVPPLPDKFDVAYVGQFAPDKGLIYLIKAWALLDFPEETLILAGDDGAKVLDTITSLNRGNWHLAGYVDDISEIYKKCSVYVQPSVTEGFGIPVLEAMAHGRPVIVSQGAGAHEIVEDGKEGFVVPIRNPEAIAEKILYFHDNPDEVKRMGRNARLKAEQYTWDKIRKIYEGLYVEGC